MTTISNNIVSATGSPFGADGPAATPLKGSPFRADGPAAAPSGGSPLGADGPAASFALKNALLAGSGGGGGAGK